MQDPHMILADEPIASLDPMNAKIVMDALRRIHDATTSSSATCTRSTPRATIATG
jgi:ABC-type phosphate/phosphonate transport system ATPase subunit